MTKNDRSVILTGGNGFLGSAIARGLLVAGYQVKVIRRQASRMDRLSDIASQIEYLSFDTSSAEELATFVKNSDLVIHTAGSYCRQGESVVEAIQANVIFGLTVLEAAIEQNVGLFINTSTALPKTTNTYAQSKVQFSEWGRSLAEQGHIKFINVLLEHIYGPGDDPVKFVEHVISACLANKPILELTAGTQQRDFIYINDVVSAYLLLVEKHNHLGSEDFHEIALGSGGTVTIRSLVELIHAITESQTLLNFGAKSFSQFEVMHSCAMTTELQALGWLPKTDLQAGLKQVVDEKRKLATGSR